MITRTGRRLRRPGSTCGGRRRPACRWMIRDPGFDQPGLMTTESAGRGAGSLKNVVTTVRALGAGAALAMGQSQSRSWRCRPPTADMIPKLLVRECSRVACGDTVFGSHKIPPVTGGRCSQRRWRRRRSWTPISVPWPGGLLNSNHPPRASTQSRRPMRPEPRARSAPPAPSSRTYRCKAVATLEMDGTTSSGCSTSLKPGRQLIERRRSPEDRRRHLVELTGAGAEQLAKAGSALSAAEDKVLGALDETQPETLYSLLQQAAVDTTVSRTAAIDD